LKDTTKLITFGTPRLQDDLHPCANTPLAPTRAVLACVSNIHMYILSCFYKYFCFKFSFILVPMAVRSKSRTVFDRSNTGTVGRFPLEAWMCVRLFSVLCCVGSGLATGRSPIQGVLPNIQK